MIAEKKNNGDVRRVLISMILNRYVISKVTAMMGARADKLGPFQSPWSNLVAGWAIKHFQKYGEPIGTNIQVRFDRWANAADRDEATVEAIQSLLSGLSKESDRGKKSSEFLADLAEQVFQRVSLERMARAVLAHVENGDVDKAKSAFQEHSIPLTSVDVTDPLNMTQEEVDQVMDASAEEVLIKYPDALGKFFGDAFSRDCFVSFLGPEKRGKSFWLLDVVWRAMLAGRKVAYFEVGDMSRRQVLRRVASRATQRPLKGGSFKVPTALHIEDGALGEVEVEKRTAEVLKSTEVFKALQKIKRQLKTDRTLLKLSCHPNSSINVEQIRSTCLSWSLQDWTPDVVVIDYADILAPIDGRSESRDQINDTWKRMRRMSQEMHCCVVTATQADAASYRAKILDMTNFSDDKRKFAHVTAMIGINQSPMEKDQQVQRLNYLVMRDDDFVSDKAVFVGNCLKIANPSCVSSF